MALSRPEPGPETRTSTERTPWSRAALAALTAACCAAKGVPLREPRKPSEPELFHETVLPCWSVMVTMVLLKVAWMKTRPNGTFLRSRFLNFLFLPTFGAAAVFALDVQADFLAEVAFDLAFLLDDLTDFVELVLFEGAHLGERVNSGLVKNLEGAGIADAVNVCKGDANLFVSWQVDAGDTGHWCAFRLGPPECSGWRGLFVSG